MFLNTIFRFKLKFTIDDTNLAPNTAINSSISFGKNENTNPNETKSTVVAFFISFLVFAAMLLLLIENSAIITYIKLLLIATVMFAMRFYLLLTNIKLYYKENES